MISGEAFVVPRGGSATVDQGEAARREAVELDWRLHEVVITLVPALEPGDGRE